MKKGIIGIVLSLILSALSCNALAVELLGLEVDAQLSRIRVALDADVKVSYFTLEKPHRAVIDFKASSLHTSLPKVDTNPVIRRLRGAPRGQDYRLVVDLHQAADLSVKEVADKKNKKHYVRIELSPKKTPQLPAETGSVQAFSEDKVALKKVDELQQQKRVVLIALDAGHGGKDPGALAASGIQEKDIVLAITLELERLLDKEPGFFSKTIRRKDEYVGLEARREVARQKHADLFVSIHADAFPDPRVNGASVYVLSRKGATSATARFLAENQNASETLGTVDLSDKDALLKEVLVDLAMNDKMSASVGVGEYVLNSMGKVTKLHSPRVEKAAFAVLKTPDLPALLVETGFISNPREAQQLNSKAQQKRIARAIFEGIKRYYTKYPPEGSYLAWQQRQQ